jgi:hypothetical protein
MSEHEQAEQIATEEPEPVEEPAAETAVDDEADAAEPDGDGEGLDVLSAAMDGEQPPEPPRHWLRWPGFVGALLVVAVVILVPCGGAVLYLAGAFADPGRFTAAPDACSRLAAGTVGDRLEVAMSVTGKDRSSTGSTCDYALDRARATVASGDVAAVLSLDSYGTKGPLSAARMAHAGLNGAVTDATADDPAGLGPKPSKRVVSGVGEEAVVVDAGGRTVDVFARVSNLLVHLRLELSYTGATSLATEAVALARQVTGGLR